MYGIFRKLVFDHVACIREECQVLLKQTANVLFSQSLLKLSHSSHSTAGNFDYRTAADYYFSDSRNPNGLCYLKTMFMMNFLVSILEHALDFLLRYCSCNCYRREQTKSEKNSREQAKFCLSASQAAFFTKKTN